MSKDHPDKADEELRCMSCDERFGHFSCPNAPVHKELARMIALNGILCSMLVGQIERSFEVAGLKMDRSKILAGVVGLALDKFRKGEYGVTDA